jgi:hypothetical protein
MKYIFSKKIPVSPFIFSYLLAFIMSFTATNAQTLKIKPHPLFVQTDGGNSRDQKLRIQAANLSGKTISPTYSPQNLSGNDIYVNDAFGAGDIYTTATGDDALGDGSAAAPYATISFAISVAAAEDNIYVDAGVYAEEIEIDKTVSLRGTNYNTDPNTMTRITETIIHPAFSEPDPYSINSRSVIYITPSGSGSSVNGFTIDGDNPNLTSGVLVNGADVDAIEAIGAYEGIAGVEVLNNIIKNTNYSGVDFDNYYNGGAPTSDNLITKNYFENIMPSIFGIAIIIYDNCYTDITQNKMVAVNLGVQTGNFYQADPANSHTIEMNTIESYRRAIWHNLAYSGAANFIINQNTVTTYTGAPNNDGIMVSSLQINVGAIVTNNTISGTNTGYNLWNNPTTATVTITGGTVTNSNTGIFANNYDGYTSDAASSNYIIDGVSITGGTKGIYVKDNSLNSNNATVAVLIKNNTTVSGSTTGLTIEGGGASASFDAVTPASFNGQTVYIDQVTNGTDLPAADIDATLVHFEGVTGAAMPADDLFSTEDKITHKMDNTFLGFVTVKASNDFVTPNSGTVQRGIDLASNGWTVNVGAGTFNESLIVNKEVTIKGVKAGLLAKGRSGAESIIDPNASASHGFKIVTDNVSVDGFTITNSAAYPASSTERYGVVTIEKNGSGNFTGISVKNNIITHQFKAIDFNATDNFEISSNWLHGENDNYNYGCTWIASYGTTSSNGLITNNDLDGYSSAIEIQGNASQPVSNVTVSENRSTGGQYVLFGYQNSSVYRNSVLNVTTGSHVFIGGGCTNDVFSENFFDNGDFNGFSISNNFGAGINEALTINNNSITGHNKPGFYDIKVAAAGYTGTLNAECNWLGTANGALIAAKVFGPVNFTPWLTNGTDDDALTPGFQPVDGSCSGTPLVVTLASVTDAVCFGSSTGAVDIIVSGGSAPYTYSWTNGATTEDLTNVPSGNYSVIVTDAFGQTATLAATVNESSTLLVAASVPGTISCFGGTTTVTVSATGGLAPYSSIGGFTASAGAYSYTVTDANNCTSTTSGIITQPTQMVVTAVPGTINCPGGSTNVAVSATGGTPLYTGVGTFIASAGPNTFTVTDANTCTASKTITIANGTGTPPNKPGAITGTQYNLCGGGNRTYSISPVSGATSYVWTVPVGFTIVQNNGTSAVINIPASFTTSAQIQVAAANACGTSAANSLTLFAIAPNPSSAINGPTSVGANQNATYSLPNSANLVYTWGVPSGATITSGQGTRQIKVKFGTQSGNVTVFVSNACGSSPTGRIFVTVAALAASQDNGEQATAQTVTTFSAYPNPTKSVANISFNANKTEAYQLSLTDLTGKQLLQKTGNTLVGKNILQVNLSNYASGMYIVKLIINGKIQTLKVYKEN